MENLITNVNTISTPSSDAVEYIEAELLRLAKRFHNTKRTYLLVDPLQGKHIPVSPSACLTMLRTFGNRLREEFPQTKLVVGFAETATAVGAAAAECMGEDCVYFHTTREDVADVTRWIEFREEHSHATEQKLSADGFDRALADTDTVIFVDDELSTGKTLVNMIDRLAEAFPRLSDKRIVAASIINRMSDENVARLADRGILCRQLLKIENVDYTETVGAFDIAGASDLPENVDLDIPVAGTDIEKPKDSSTPRTGMAIGEYTDSIFARHELISARGDMTPAGRNIVVIGTEECMYPGLLIAEKLEKSGKYDSVRFHATTRSPIGISSAENYPIQNGCKLHSFYEKDRQTFLYNLAGYDSALIVTDSHGDDTDALRGLAGLLGYYGCSEIILERI